MREAVLGLLIERPSPAYMLGLRLGERLRAAELPENYVYWALEDLERRKLVVRGEPIASRDRGADAGDALPTQLRSAVYRPTPAGIAHFREWLTSPSSEPPLRDELAVRLAFCGPEDVPRLAEIVYDQERECLARIQELQFATDELEARLPESIGGSTWKTLLRALSRDAELSHWGSRVEWLQSVREMLEGLASKNARP